MKKSVVGLCSPVCGEALIDQPSMVLRSSSKNRVRSRWDDKGRPERHGRGLDAVGAEHLKPPPKYMGRVSTLQPIEHWTQQMIILARPGEKRVNCKRIISLPEINRRVHELPHLRLTAGTKQIDGWRDLTADAAMSYPTKRLIETPAPLQIPDFASMIELLGRDLI